MGDLDAVSTTAVHPDENIRCRVPERLRLIAALNESQRQDLSPTGKIRHQDFTAMFDYLGATFKDVTITLDGTDYFQSSKTLPVPSERPRSRRPADNQPIQATNAADSAPDEIHAPGIALFIVLHLTGMMLAVLIPFLDGSGWISGFAVIPFLGLLVNLVLNSYRFIFKARSSTGSSSKNK